MSNWVTGSGQSSAGWNFCFFGGLLALIGGFACLSKSTNAVNRGRCVKVAGGGGLLLTTACVWAAISNETTNARMLLSHPVQYATGTDVYGKAWASHAL